MGRRHSGALPGIRLHKPTGHARVRINGTEYWLGRYGSPEAQLKYDELVATYIASGRNSVEAATRPPAPPPPAAALSADLTVAELALRWLRHIMDTCRPNSRMLSLKGRTNDATRFCSTGHRSRSPAGIAA